MVVGTTVRRYGDAPYSVVVIHGGPGASGEMAPVARALGPRWGVIEPMQTATTLQDQVDELRCAIEAYADRPVALIGFSWGAWLGYLLAAQHPALARTLILVGSGPYRDTYAARITPTRLCRLNAAERAEMSSILEQLADPAAGDARATYARLGELAQKTDTVDPVDEQEAPGASDDLPRLDPADAARVLAEAQALRASGALLEAGRQIRCPVVAIHGAQDPHPAEGVREPLSGIVADFTFHALEHCGHKPWVERHARDEFYRILEDALC
jgi:pimeloyl-ACP methyl ester carboxylesterase